MLEIDNFLSTPCKSQENVLTLALDSDPIISHESQLNAQGTELEFSTPTSGTHSHWNWQMQESFHHPGADVAFMDAEDVGALCNNPDMAMARLRNVGHNANYSIELDDLYRCASDNNLFDTPMPTIAPVPITGVHWVNEGTGLNVGLWTSVHNMRMRLPSPINPCPLCLQSLEVKSAESTFPPVAAFANETPNEVSIVAERFLASCKKSAKCWQENRRYLNGKPRKRSENPDIFVGNLHDAVRVFVKDK